MDKIPAIMVELNKGVQMMGRMNAKPVDHMPETCCNCAGGGNIQKLQHHWPLWCGTTYNAKQNTRTRTAPACLGFAATTPFLVTSFCPHVCCVGAVCLAMESICPKCLGTGLVIFNPVKKFYTSYNCNLSISVQYDKTTYNTHTPHIDKQTLRSLVSHTDTWAHVHAAMHTLSTQMHTYMYTYTNTHTQLAGPWSHPSANGNGSRHSNLE